MSLLYNETLIDGFIIEVPENSTMYIDKSFSERKVIIPVGPKEYSDLQLFVK